MASFSLIHVLRRTLTSLFFIALGSSGDWVVLGDKLCGYIVAIRQDIPWAYMVAIQPVLEDIGRKFKTDDVRLPTVDEIDSCKLFSKGQVLSWLYEPEGTQASDSEGNQAAISACCLNKTRKASGAFTSRNIGKVPEEILDEQIEQIEVFLMEQDRLVDKKSHTPYEQGDSLNERSSMKAYTPQTSMVESSPAPYERVCENIKPERSTMGQRSSTPPSTTHCFSSPRTQTDSLPLEPSTDLESQL